MLSVYSCTASALFPTINILVPSELKATPRGAVSCAETVNWFPLYDALETSNAFESVYSKTSGGPAMPTTNIFVPSGLNVSPHGIVSCPASENESTKVTVSDKSNAVLSVYSLTSFPPSPTTNILVPLVLNAMPRGAVSCAETEKEFPVYDALETSNPNESVYSKTISD